MSIQLLLEEFLGLMREDGELDVFLPTLLSSMGHQIQFRAQKGVRQYGVDIISVGRDSDGVMKLFLWLVKCGDIGRTEWNSGHQAIRPSIDEVGDVYIATHILPNLKGLPIKLVVLTNGDFLSVINLHITSYLAGWATRFNAETDMIGRSILAGLTSKFLLNEYALPPTHQSLFRRMLANVNSPEISVAVCRELIDALLSDAKAMAKSERARRKQLLTALRGIRTSLFVLSVWAKKEENLSAPYDISEYAILAVWSKLQIEMIADDRKVAAEIGELVLHFMVVGETYHAKLEPYYVTDSAFAHALPNSILVSERVFEEIGRLGLLGYISSFYALLLEKGETASHGHSAAHLAACAHSCAARIEALLETHTCSLSPINDFQANDIFLGVLCLIATKREQIARNWLFLIVDRLRNFAGNPQFMPLNATFEEHVSYSYGFSEPESDSMGASTLIPILALWAAALGNEKIYAALRDDIVPNMPDTTLNMWTPSGKFDEMLSDPMKLIGDGIGDTYPSLPSTGTEFLKNILAGHKDFPQLESFTWYFRRLPFLPLIAARHWKLQIPRQLAATLAVEFAKYCQIQ